MGRLSNISPYKGDGTTPLLQKWLDILYESLRGDVITDTNINITKLGTVVNLTSATSDYELSVGETAKIDITTDTTALNIAVEDGVYELVFEFDISTFSADRDINLRVNNTTYTNEFLITRSAASTAFATDEIDTNDLTADEHRMTAGVSGNGLIRPYRIDCRLVINGNRTSLFSSAYGTAGGTRIQGETYSVRTATPAHTSLGTLSTTETCTGVGYVRRTA